MGNKKVGVVIPVYNGEKYIEKCVKALLQQDYENFEILIVNDGSTDGTKQICEELKLRDSRIKLISISNQGVSVARNIGIQASDGEYISFVDCDDYVESDFLSTLVLNLEKENADISVCNYYYVVDDVPHPIDIPEKYCGLLGQEQFFAGLIDNCYRGFLWNKMFRKELFYRNGELIKMKEGVTICEDLLFVVTIASKSKRFYIEKKPLYNYVQVKSSAYNAGFKNNRITEIIAYDEIIRIVSGVVPSLTMKYKEAYLKMALKIYESFICSIQFEKSDEVRKVIYRAVQQYYNDVKCADTVSMSKKIYYAFYKRFPRLIHFVKKVYHTVKY